MSYASALAALSPVLWWKLDETSGSTASDSSGNGYDGTFSEPTKLTYSVAGIPGAGDAIQFLEDNTNSPSVYKTWETDFALATTGEITFTWWYRTTVGGAFDTSLGLGTGGSHAAVNKAGGEVLVEISTPNYTTSGAQLRNGYWHQIALTVKRDTGGGVYRRTTYIDGRQMGQSTATFSDPGSPGYLVLGDSSAPASSPGGASGTYAEFAVFPSELSAAQVQTLYREGMAFTFPAFPVPLPLTVSSAGASFVQALTAGQVAAPLTVWPGVAGASAGFLMHPKAIPSVAAVLGPHVTPTPVPMPIQSAAVVVGPVAPIQPQLVTVVTPMPIESVSVVNGPWMIPPPPPPPVLPSDPVPPVVEVLPGVWVDASLKVDHDSAFELSASCKPQMNGVGAGSFKCRTAPGLGARVGFTVAGQHQFTGIVDATVDHQVVSDEEAGQAVDVTCIGQISELDKVKVLPDFGAADLTRLGPPTQDIRVFDWTMNGLGNVGFGEQAATIIPSDSADMIDLDAGGQHPLPDVWPDADARWMWSSNPGGVAGRGWTIFRVATPAAPGPTDVDFWVASAGYAELWVDGVPIATCDQPYRSQHLRIDAIDKLWHRVAIKAFTTGGTAGVLFSMLPIHNDGLYGTAIMNSRTGWDCIVGGDRTFISTPGQVMHRLLDEARRRGSAAAAGWTGSFGNLVDSAGRPWERREAIEIEVGKSYLDVLQQLAEDRVDWAEDPASKRIHMWRKGEGSGRTPAIPWAQGVDLDLRDHAKVTR